MKGKEKLKIIILMIIMTIFVGGITIGIGTLFFSELIKLCENPTIACAITILILFAFFVAFILALIWVTKDVDEIRRKKEIEERERLVKEAVEETSEDISAMKETNIKVTLNKIIKDHSKMDFYYFWFSYFFVRNVAFKKFYEEECGDELTDEINNVLDMLFIDFVNDEIKKISNDTEVMRFKGIADDIMSSVGSPFAEIFSVKDLLLDGQNGIRDGYNLTEEEAKYIILKLEEHKIKIPQNIYTDWLRKESTFNGIFEDIEDKIDELDTLLFELNLLCEIFMD